jgi:hypothetical protein
MKKIKTVWKIKTRRFTMRKKKIFFYSCPGYNSIFKDVPIARIKLEKRHFYKKKNNRRK